MGKSFWKDCKKEKCDRESFLEISQEGKSVGARVWEWNHEREKWGEGRNGDGGRTLITCSTLNFIQNLDGLYFVQWLIENTSTWHGHDVFGQVASLLRKMVDV